MIWFRQKICRKFQLIPYFFTASAINMHNSPGPVSFMLQNHKQIFRFYFGFSHDILPHSEFIYGFSVFIFSFTIIIPYAKGSHLSENQQNRLDVKQFCLQINLLQQLHTPISIKRHSHLQKSYFQFIQYTDFLDISMYTLCHQPF